MSGFCFSGKRHGGSVSNRVLDFSANTSPLGMHPASSRALARVSLEDSAAAAYPDSECVGLRNLLGEFWSFPPESIICGNGASELIHLVSCVFFSGTASVLEPAFSEYGISLWKAKKNMKKASVKGIFADYDDEASFSSISLPPGNSVLFAASPSNPLGKVLSFNQILSLEKECERSGSVFVLDSCFCQFSKRAENVLRSVIERRDDFPNLVVLNAFTKFYGMAGIRLGYALCFSEGTAATLRSSAVPWSVGYVAQKCGEAVLESEIAGTDFCPPSSWTLMMRAHVESERRRFETLFERCGVEFVKSEANFISFKFRFPTSAFVREEGSVVEKSGDAAFLHSTSSFDGIDSVIMRSCADFPSLGEDWHRLAIKSVHENDLMLSCLGGMFGESSREKIRREKRAKCLMVQGTMSNSGKSLLVAALCRIFRNDGFRVAPFKSQNMALNSGVTADGKEMGRAQIMQAEAARALPDVRMNPVLLKPNSESGSQVIVDGEILCSMSAKDYFSYRKELMPRIMESFESLSEENDIIVIEGAGSPAEINLRENDIVNMGLAERIGAPVLIVGDIDRGGVFASLYGTFALLKERERNLVKGFVVNKFRGDVSLLGNGLSMLRDLTGRDVLGVVPYMSGLRIDDEDSLSDSLSGKCGEEKKLLKIAVVRLPYISNFTDLDSFARLPFVGVEFFDSADAFDMDADLLVIPGSKNSVKSMEFLDDSGISDKIRSFAVGKPVVGVCGGFQLLGEILDDSAGNEDSSAKKVRGLSLLPTRTFFDSKKIRVLVSENLPPLDGFFSFLSGKKACGYEIHQGSTSVAGNGGSLRILSKGNVLGTYIHGFFDSSEIVSSILCALAKKRGVEIPPFGDFRTEKDAEFDRLERIVRGSVDVGKLYEIMGIDRKV